MVLELEDLKVLQRAGLLSDRVWNEILRWKHFEKESVGSQLVRSADSIGANIAEAYGRFHYGEKLSFLYYARGSLFETRYWINRGIERRLIDIQDAEKHRSELTIIAKQLNSLAKQVKSKRNKGPQNNVITEFNSQLKDK